MGFLDRLLGRAGIQDNTLVRTTVKQHFTIKVPEANATAVQSALERWAASKGWATVVSSQRDGDQVKLSLDHDESMPGKPPELHTDSTVEELQRVIQDAVKSS